MNIPINNMNRSGLSTDGSQKYAPGHYHLRSALRRSGAPLTEKELGQSAPGSKDKKVVSFECIIEVLYFGEKGFDNSSF